MPSEQDVIDSIVDFNSGGSTTEQDVIDSIVDYRSAQRPDWGLIAEATSTVDGSPLRVKLYRANSDNPSHRLVLYGDSEFPIDATVKVNGTDMGTFRLPSPDLGPGFETPRIEFVAGSSPATVTINGKTVLEQAVDTPGSQTEFVAETGTEPYSPAEGGNYQTWAESEAEDAAEASLDDRAGATIEDEVLADAREAAQDDISSLPTAGAGDAPTQQEIADALSGATSDAQDVAQDANEQIDSMTGSDLPLGLIAVAGAGALFLIMEVSN